MVVSGACELCLSIRECALGVVVVQVRRSFISLYAIV